MRGHGVCRETAGTTMTPPDDAPREVLFEFRQVGGAVRVAAIDAATGIEVTVMGPAAASRADLQRLALAKLKARLAAQKPPAPR
jgi:hypothetical protein